MAKRRELFTVDFWYRTLVRTLHAFGAGCLGPLGAHQVNLVGAVPWYGVLTSGGIGAAISLFTSLTTIRLEEADEEIRALEREHTKAVLQQGVSPITIEQAKRPIYPPGYQIPNVIEVDNMGKHSKEERTQQNSQDDFVITGLPPEREQFRPPRAPRTVPPETVTTAPREPWTDYSTPNPMPTQTPEVVVPEEDWPQGGRRGKHSKREEQ